MLKLVKYLKPYRLMILLAIVLLFIQANADLALPDYLSRIVNTGIQQGGVESAVPAALRQIQFDRLAIFMSDDAQAQVLARYTLVDQTSPDYPTLVGQYPALANEPVYVLNAITPEEIETLNPVLGKAWLVVSGIEQALGDPAKAQEMAGSLGGAMPGGAALDLSKLPPGMDVFSLLRRLPTAQRATISAAVDQRFTAMGDRMVVQASAAAVKAELTALGMDPGALQNRYILRAGLSMLLLTLLSAACTISVGFISAQTAAGLARDLRKNVFQKVESFSSTEFDQFSTASLITRSTNDITQIQTVMIMMVRMVFYAPIMGVGGVIRAIDKSSSMWWIIAIAVIVLLGLITIIFSLSLPRFKVIQKLIDRLNLVSREGLAGMLVIRAFNMQAFEEKRFDAANLDLTRVNLFVNRVMAVMFPFMMLIMNALSVTILWVGAHQVAQSQMQVGDMMAFMQYAMQIVFSFLMVSIMFIILPRASVSAERIVEVLDTEPQIKDPEQPKQFAAGFQGVIEFRNVSFRYPGGLEDALSDITFTARPGQTTALIGATGAGKSTVVNLIPRFYEVTQGAIEIDGVDIRQVTQHDLRDKIGYVPQKSNLFSGTIASNLLYADENAAPEELHTAAEIAQAGEFIAARPEGLEAAIAQGGANVSGGQKQRLSIARALVKKAPIYIFDDSFSALDFRTDAALRRALKDKTGHSTLLIVTQRVSTIKNADQIIVLDEGRMVGKGTHPELMETCETYRGIALSQLNNEELA